MITNPSFVYVISFSIAIFFYYFDWVSIYPPLGVEIIIFFSVTFVFSMIMFLFFDSRQKLIPRSKIKITGYSFEYFYVLGFCFEFVYSKSIPFFEIVLGRGFDYSQFGVPVFHVLVMTYVSAVGVVRFYSYLLERGRVKFFISFLPIVFFLLVYNRGAIIIQLSTYLFVYFCINKLKVRFLFLFIPFIILFMYMFGVLGNIRSGGDVMEITLEPTDYFYSSGLPKEFLWTYSYITSPISNFQYTLQELNCEISNDEKICNNFFGLFVSEFIPDVLGKRISTLFNVDIQIPTPLVVENLNASTTFSRAYAYFGWVGALLMFFWIFGFFLIFEKIFKKTNLRIPVRAIMCSIMAFSFFANMLSFSGIVLQLFWMLVFRRLLK